MDNKLERSADERLKGYAKDWKIFIDTCSLLSDNMEALLNHLLPYLKQYDNKLIVPYRCIQELEKFIPDGNNISRGEKAKITRDNVINLYKSGVVDIRGEQSDNFADNVFLTVFTKFRLKYNLLLITQDNNLAKDILNINNSKSVKAYPVQALRVNKYGFLSPFRWEEYEGSGKYSKENKGKFKICSQLTDVSVEVVPVQKIPCENDYVKTNRGSICLKEKIAAGGEGTIYATNTPYVAKIYKAEKITERKQRKLELMLTKKVDCTGICYPVDIIYNKYDEFVGFLMPPAKGKELQKAIFIPPLLKKTFPTWKKRDLVELAVTILNKIKFLNDMNIIMGDINPLNILVVSSKEVFFVDTDSYQIEDFPCPVGTVNYTAPEIQGRKFTDFLRTIGNENFAIATLLFMLMLPGKPPYSQQGGANPSENIKKMDFSYPFGDNSNKKTPDGPWRFMWSHLTYRLKKAFYNTFTKDGEYAQEHCRLSADKWLVLFNEYLNLLDTGKFGEQDKMSEDLFPTRFKKNPNITYITCKICSKEAEEHLSQNGICKSCLNEGERYKCKRCGKELIFTNYQKYIKQTKKFDFCPECFAWGNDAYTTVRCSDCTASFIITNNEYSYYMSKGLQLPRRCRRCREMKKNRW
ncbi:hypothetical protein D081_0815 [Anaerovibrio sp. JC8]|uniref:protein kinase domain-containing protein n=1 Tax=Anaerovibrio sp. JC8 TaxID=1240085 RepID=UPI000A0CD676|nr:zinc-ribbon domain containing protein [Anaerovibrio sp. JC8]ORU00833.1 hypothetical protein D081_0815 [Anaerovibrio sp. JC8]